MKIPQDLINKAQEVIFPFQYEGRQDLENTRYIYLHNLLYLLFKPEIAGSFFKFNSDFPIDITCLPNYTLSLKDKVFYGIPDHAIISTHTKKPTLLVEEDKSGKTSLNRATLQCCFYTAAYACRNQLPYYYSVGTNLEKFIFIKYTLEKHHIELSMEYEICKAKDRDIKFDLNELKLVANILRYIALELNK